MSRAYELARQHRTHPNPRVGCVVVVDGHVVGEGAHAGPGHAHAETVALDAAGDVAGAIVYVSLEPCTHQGQTPPCVDRLIDEGVARVVIGATDPDPRVSGAGIGALRGAGIDVEVLDDTAARELDAGYFHHRETGMPLVTVKWAMTLDGSVAAADRTSRWISSERSREDAHRLRSNMDAVVIGAGTLRADDPRLDVRLQSFDGPQPRPVVVAGRGEIPGDALLWKREPIVFAGYQLSIPSGEMVVVPDVDGYPGPVEVCRALADRGMFDILLEGGPTLAGAWWRAGVIDRGIVYIGAKIGGGRGHTPLAGVFESIADADEVEMEMSSVDGEVRISFRKKV